MIVPNGPFEEWSARQIEGEQIMSELAFNSNGDSFDVPANVTGWRVRRLKPRGAPELVYGRDGRPLTIPIESDIPELREAVSGVLGRYRLDPVNDDGKVVDSVPAAYVQVVKAERNAADAVAQLPAPRDEADGVIREAMRPNTELARAVVDRFPEMMTAAAELLRAADGAGLPKREPRGFASDDDDEDTQPNGFDFPTLIAKTMPMLMAALSGGKGEMPGLEELLDWRKAAPKHRSHPQLGATDAGAGVPENANDVLPPIDPAAMAHFIAVQAALTPEESAIARAVAAGLSASELRAWFEELRALSVPQAVEKIRVLIGGKKEAVS